MVERVNRGDKEALRELMNRCTRPMYDRAMELTGDVYAAKDAVRRALREMAEAARRGECPENAEEWAVMLAQRCCDEEMYYKRLIDSMIEGLPLAPRTVREQSAAQRADERPAQAEPLGSFSPERGTALEQAPEEKPLARSMRAMPGFAAGEKAVEEMREEEEREDIFAPPKPRRSRAPREDVPDLFSEENAPRGEYGDEDDDDEEDREQAKGGGALALLIIVLTVVAAGLLWVIAVKFMKLGYFNMSDFGFADWFNEHLFKFY